MRLWSIHPKYLDASGLVALWRESLLAQKVLLGGTKAYVNHPQLDRFKIHPLPIDAIGFYLGQIYQEASIRGYNFNKSKIIKDVDVERISVNKGQLEYEIAHLKKKLQHRSPAKFNLIIDIMLPETHSLFYMINGDIAAWEVI
jgi:hypothetical protein